MMTDKKYIIQFNGRYYYFRRIPGHMKEFDKRTFIKIALKTDSREAALTKARIINTEIENYWKKLAVAGEKHTDAHFKQTLEFARNLGFSYLPHHQLIQEKPISEIVERVAEIDKANLNKRHTEALWGGVSPPEITLQEGLEVYWGYTKDRIIKKDEHEIRKWENPRKKAIKTWVNLIGNKRIIDLTHDDALALRDHWIIRIQEEECSPSSANKDFIHAKDVVGTVCSHRKIKIDLDHIFNKISMKEDDGQRRLPFETDYIINTFLPHDFINSLTEDEKWFLHAMSETGARDSELLRLNEKTIILDHSVPHISIEKGKTSFSRRKIPLVGYALDAFKARPNGFTSYYNQADKLSTYLNRVLRNKKLFPSEMYSIYSFRHSFQDRILAADAPDRVQADLMGHKFKREAYGHGASLEQKQEWLKKIQLKNEAHI